MDGFDTRASPATQPSGVGVVSIRGLRPLLNHRSSWFNHRRGAQLSDEVEAGFDSDAFGSADLDSEAFDLADVDEAPVEGRESVL